MAITYIGKSSMYSNTVTVVVPVPVGYAEGDVLILTVGSSTAYASTPSGWTVLASSAQPPVFHRVYGKYATASEASVSVDAGPSTAPRARMFCFRGLSATDAIGDYVTSNNTGGDFACSSVTSTLNGCVAFFSASFVDSSTEVDTANYSNWSFANVGAATELCDAQSVLVNVLGIVACMAYIPAAGASGALTATLTDTEDAVTSGILILFHPEEEPVLPVNVKVKIGGAWKDGIGFVKIGGAWKTVTAIKSKIGGAWK